MVRHSSCIAYECKSRSTKEESKELSWHLFPLSDKELLRTWLIKIKRTNTPVSKNSYLGSKHFEEECFIKPFGGQRIRLKPVSVPTKFVFTVQRKERKRPCCRGEAMDTIKRTKSKKINFHGTTDDVTEDDQLEFCQPLDRTQPDEDFSVDHHEPEESREDELEAKISCFYDKISELEKLLLEERSNKKELEILSTRRAFNIENIKNNNKLMRFYTGFDSYETFSMLLDFLGRDSASQLNYKNNETSECNSRSRPGRSRTLRTENEFFMLLCRFKVGLLVEDIAARFGVCQRHVYRSLTRVNTCTLDSKKLIFFLLVILSTFTSLNTLLKSTPAQLSLLMLLKFILNSHQTQRPNSLPSLLTRIATHSKLLLVLYLRGALPLCQLFLAEASLTKKSL